MSRPSARASMGPHARGRRWGASWTLSLVLLGLLMMLPEASTATSPPTEIAREQQHQGRLRPIANVTNANKENVDQLIDATDHVLSAAATGCGLCQQTGLCDHAFRGHPGQFCTTLVSGLPCCCPRDAQCVNNMYACRCRKPIPSPPQSPHGPTRVVTHTTTTTTTTSGSKSISLVGLLVLLCCVVCCIMAARKSEEEQPVYVATASQYGATAQSPVSYGYGYPSAPPMAQCYGGNPSGGGDGASGAVAAGAVGAVAGLATGMLFGSALGGGNQQQTTTTTTTSYFDGDTGFNNASTSAFEFSGDTGGGDYGGDDGGDFGGDS